MRARCCLRARAPPCCWGSREGGAGAWWPRGPVVGLLIASAVLLAAFVLVERRAAQPLIPLGLFRNPMVRAAAATGLLSGMAMFGAIAYIPLFLQAVVGSTATQAGFVLTPFILGWVTFSILGARLCLRVGYRGGGVAGLGGVVGGGMAWPPLGFLLFGGWSESPPGMPAGSHIVLAGIGMGLVFVPM